MITGQMLYEKLLELRPINPDYPTPASWDELLPVAKTAYEGLANYVNELIKGENK